MWLTKQLHVKIDAEAVSSCIIIDGCDDHNGGNSNSNNSNSNSRGNRSNCDSDDVRAIELNKRPETEIRLNHPRDNSEVEENATKRIRLD